MVAAVPAAIQISDLSFHSLSSRFALRYPRGITPAVAGSLAHALHSLRPGKKHPPQKANACHWDEQQAPESPVRFRSGAFKKTK